MNKNRDNKKEDSNMKWVIQSFVITFILSVDETVSEVPAFVPNFIPTLTSSLYSAPSAQKHTESIKVNNKTNIMYLNFFTWIPPFRKKTEVHYV